MKLEKYKNKKVFHFCEDDVTSMVIPLDTSSGNRAGPKVVHEHGGVLVKFTVAGTKFLQQERAKREVLRMIEAFQNDIEYDLTDKAWIITFKPEVLFGKTLEEQAKFRDKVRIYFIPSTEYYLLARLMQGYRQKVERGNVIRIGMTWWYGGAYDFAKYFRYDKGDTIWYMGDFTGLDSSIKFQLLMLYSYSAKYYYRTGGDEKLYDYLLGKSAIHLSAKITNVFGRVWRYMFGVMPSGAYETSHGDSWIVALLYFTYFLMMSIKYPAQCDEIIRCVEELLIMVSIYGDDSVLGVPKHLQDYVNIHGFADFCTQYFDMSLRDLETITEFLAVPDVRTGELMSSGVVFLQRSFISKDHIDTLGVDVPDVLPYRGLRKIVQKSVFGSGDLKHPVEHLVSFIGMAYDTQGTNVVAYRYCRFMYEYILKQINMEFDEAISLIDCFGNKTMVKLMRKMGLSIDQICEGFPTRERLMKMHVYDASKLVDQLDVPVELVI
jgi:hypothetical protein